VRKHTSNIHSNRKVVHIITECDTILQEYYITRE